MSRIPATTEEEIAVASELRRFWSLDPAIRFLNHGSYGACPRAVLEEQSRLRAELEANPVRFLTRELEPRLDAALASLGAFIGAPLSGLAFVPNATAAVNAVLRSLEFAPGDEILVTDHAYEACMNAARHVAGPAGAKVVVARVPFPIRGEEEVMHAVLGAAGQRTRLALLDHVTSATALVWPIGRLVRALEARGIDTLVDGAHAPGMLPVDLLDLRPAYYAGNCHKWICAPKGAGFLYVRADRQNPIFPVAISGLSDRARGEKPSLRARFDWTGTHDPTAALCVPRALDHVSSLAPGGWPAVMAANRALALRGRKIVCDALGCEPAAPDGMIGSMAAILLPPAEAVEERLRSEGFEVPVYGRGQQLVMRISAHLHNDESEYRELAAALGRSGV